LEGPEFLLTASLFLPLLGAIVAPFLTRIAKHNAAWVLSLFLFAPFFIFLSHLAEIRKGSVILGGFSWAPSLGLNFAWRLDGLSLVFALLISGIGTLILLYSGGYLKGHPQQGRFFSFILMFSAAMLGVVLSDSLLMLFIYWELTSITSFLLIGFDHQRQAARRAAYQALLVTGGGGLFLLAGLLVLQTASGLGSMSALIAHAETVRGLDLAPCALGLILVGAFTKSAQFPFHFWLPNAMEAPTPVSAYLHSATMVKAGVYLLMRLYPVFGETALWQTILPLFGGLTVVIGGFLALGQSDLKLMLAYTTVASLGLLVMLTGIGSDEAITAAVLYLFAHALFKGAFFMISGIIDHETGCRDITKLGGLRRAMPLTSAVALLAALSMGGLPLFAGFLAKEEIYSALGAGTLGQLLMMASAILGNAMMFGVAFAIAVKPFAGKAIETPKRPHDGPVLLTAGPVVLAVAGLVAGLGFPLLHAFVTSPMASAISGHSITADLSIVPHLSLPLALSALTILLGSAIFVLISPVRSAAGKLLDAIGWGPDRGFDQAVASLIGFSWRVQRLIQPGRLELYLTATFIVIAATLIVPLFVFSEMPAWPVWPRDLQIHEAGFMLIAIAGLFAVLIARTRVTAIVSLGIQGFAVAMLYMLFGAPDLSFTQFMVETLSVVILALIMTRLRLNVDDNRSGFQMLMDGTIAIACGFGFSAFLLKTVQVPFNPELTAFFNQYSKVLAHGANVVNVIIVDFRGTDTMGEISVVVITGLAILALVRLRPVSAPIFNDPGPEEGEGT
jgi:multicomponent Na+:H+ antiporter subunit A